MLNRSHTAQLLRIAPHELRLTALESIELLQRGPKVGRSMTYRLNPNFGWKGSAKNHLKAIDSGLKERMKERGMSVVPTDEPAA